MANMKLDHISVVVEDLPAAIEFFTVLGMTIEGKAPIKGPWVDRINGLKNVRIDIVMMRTPDGGDHRLAGAGTPSGIRLFEHCLTSSCAKK